MEYREFAEMKINKPIVVKFYIDNCFACKAMDPHIERTQNEFKDIDFISINVTNSPEAIDDYKITSAPCTVFLDEQKEIKATEFGLRTYPQLSAIINDVLVNDVLV